ncbi:MAG: chorismate-binding protein, partial [Novosphingobium sp.]
MNGPFILLDDARPEGASPARLYRDPLELVVARRVEDVAPALARIEALRAAGHHLAGYMAYEAGLALEERLVPLAAARTGANGPLLWFGAFTGYTEIAARDVPAWLADNGSGPARIGPLDPALSAGAYSQVFAALQEAIAAGDIYQANLTFPLTGTWRGEPLAIYAALRPAAGAGYGGVVYDGSHWLLSFSPELFFAEKDG